MAKGPRRRQLSKFRDAVRGGSAEKITTLDGKLFKLVRREHATGELKSVPQFAAEVVAAYKDGASTLGVLQMLRSRWERLARSTDASIDLATEVEQAEVLADDEGLPAKRAFDQEHASQTFAKGKTIRYVSPRKAAESLMVVASAPHWTCRDQGKSKLCVAHAAVGLWEFLRLRADPRVPCHLSMQLFIHEAIARRKDRTPREDGLCYLSDAAAALQHTGPALMGEVEVGPGLNVVIHDKVRRIARSRRLRSKCYELRNPCGRNLAQKIYDQLYLTRRPVAIAVKWDPGCRCQTAFGAAMGAPDQKRAPNDGFAHALLVVGYIRAKDAPGGGWFIARNSIGKSAYGVLPGGLVNGQPHFLEGFDLVSASYVEAFLTEYLVVPNS